MPGETTILLLPEIVLAAVAVAVYLGGTTSCPTWVWRWVALVGIVASGITIQRTQEDTATDAPARTVQTVEPGSPANAGGSGETDTSARRKRPIKPSSIEIDPLATFARWLSLGAGGLLVLLAWRSLEGPNTPEYVGSLLLATAGTMLVGAARDVVLLFVSLELVSIPTYLLLYLGRSDLRSQEATTKYFFLSILASAMFLYGVSFLYGATGATHLDAIQGRLDQPTGLAVLAPVALALVVAGLAFRIAAAPFHFYAPDVYQGATMAGAALLSVIPKIAGLLALIRVVAVAMPAVTPYAWPVIVVLSALSMTLGNTAALWQDNLRRLLAYSSIAHAGYLLMGLAIFIAHGGEASPHCDGLKALLFYLVVYAVATLGTFAALAALERRGRPVETVEDLSGLAWTGGLLRPAMAWTLAILLFSLAGLPPMAGFWGKLTIFASSLRVGRLEMGAKPWFIVLAVLGVLNSAIGAAYYLRIVGVMFFRHPGQEQSGKMEARGPWSAALGCALATLVIGLYPGPWIRAAGESGPRTMLLRLALPRSTASWPACDPAAANWPDCSTRQPGPSTRSTTSNGSSTAIRPAWNGSADRPTNCTANVVSGVLRTK